METLWSGIRSSCLCKLKDLLPLPAHCNFLSSSMKVVHRSLETILSMTIYPFMVSPDNVIWLTNEKYSWV